jgi:hypothetical protein
MVGITLEKGYRICLIMSDDQAVDGYERLHQLEAVVPCRSA